MRNCIILLNLANFAGTLNHSMKNPDGTYGKLRVDYKDLLEYLVGQDRKLLGAYVVSQQDISTSNTKSLEQLQANQRFVQKLSNFGWTPLRVSYNREAADTTPMLDSIWQNALSSLMDEEGNWTVNPHLTDIVFVNGSAAWYDIIAAFFSQGFSVEVAYPKIATSKILMANFAFFDTTPFLMSNNAKVIERMTNRNNTNG